MSLKPFYCEQQVKVGDEAYRLVVNFGMIDATESLTNRGFDEILAELLTVSPPPRMGTIGRVLWGLLREHHPKVTLEEAAGLMFGDTGETIGIAIGKLMMDAFPEEKEKGANPPKPRGASRRSSRRG